MRADARCIGRRVPTAQFQALHSRSSKVNQPKQNGAKWERDFTCDISHDAPEVRDLLRRTLAV
jgi:hypothetical protein